MMFYLALATLAFLTLFSIESGIGNLRLRSLSSLPATGEDWPRVSIVVAGRNEERAVEHAVSSLLALDYPDLEVVFVNDRSADATGAILDRLAADDLRLRVIHLTDLPDGWLGKNHALHVGADVASGALVLFTDADVMFEPSTLRRAVRYLLDRDLDHLTASPRIVVRSPIVGMFVASFGLFFSIFSKPWRATGPNPKHHVGIGAFNLVRSSIYRKVGGHQPIRMRPDDDMKLAKLLKKNGGRQELVFGRDLISVEWYPTIREVVVGLEKNAFSGVEYSTARLALATISVLALFVWPFVGVFATGGTTRLLNIAIAAMLLGSVAVMATRSGAGPFYYAFFFPIGTLLFLYIMVRAGVKNLRDGGIVWRGTLYPLEELRKNKV
jgi:glycosyltransferase involved in cell wall biosynthesis